MLAVIVATASLTLLLGDASAGAKDGPRRWTKVLKKNTEVVYKITFVASPNPVMRSAEFSVIGDGGTDVDIEVYDASGKLVVKDIELTDLAFVRWVPTQTQVYTVRVKNLGTEDNTCHMGHN